MLITFTGESGSGKSTIARSLINLGDFYFVTSTTTRSARATDLFNEYEYVSQEEFKQLKHEAAFIWDVSYKGNSYGTKFDYLNLALESINAYYILIVIPDVLPILLQHSKEINDVIPFFVRTPAESVLRKRMKERGDSTESIEKRLQNLGVWEIEAETSQILYRFITNEDSIEDAVKQVLDYLK